MSNESLNRKLAAILYADVAGYSRLMELDQIGTHRQLSAALDLMTRYIEQAGGRVVHYAGDAVLAEFTSVVTAVETAVRIQRQIAAEGADIPPDRRLRFRVGVNVGEVIVDRDEIYGEGVNVAARLQGLAQPGGICISRKVLDEVRDTLNVGYEYIGERRVKNIAAPIHAYQVRLDAQAAGTVLGDERQSGGRRRWVIAAGITVLTVGVVTAVWLARPWPPDTQPGSQTSASFPEIARPSRHFKVEAPAELAAADAMTIYDRIREDLAKVYRRSGDPHVENYQSWRRYNLTPYISATHGKRYVNNYANAKASAYGRFEDAGTLPEGSVLAKDSFEVTERGDVVTGPIALMEKMAPGFNPQTRDWRYTMVMPDGELFGTTNGEGSRRVEFCAECHRAAGEENDHLFFVPEAYRVRFLGTSDPER